MEAVHFEFNPNGQKTHFSASFVLPVWVAEKETAAAQLDTDT